MARAASSILAAMLPLGTQHCVALLHSPAPERRSPLWGGEAAPITIRIARPPTSTSLNNQSKRSSGVIRRRRRMRENGEGNLESCYLIDGDGKGIDHLGIAKSIDREYAEEEAKLNLSFWEVLERERQRPPEDMSPKSREMSPWARARRRMRYARGDVENKYTLMTKRSYGEGRLLDKDHLADKPGLEDLNVTPAPFKETFWSTPAFRLVQFVVVYYLVYPAFLWVFRHCQTVASDEFDIVTGQIAPNVGILYATLLTLTLQVLYARQASIQENATTEAMLLSQVARNLLCLFDKDKERAIEACQLVANQIRMMVSRSRGVELLSIMKADTYSKLLNIVDDYHYLYGCDETFTSRDESVTNMLRSEIGQLMETRALRLSDEASALPPTHFLLLTSLSLVSTVAFVTSSFKFVVDDLHPPVEASLLFAADLGLYIFFFNFCRDLNGPYGGVYQIKRSNAVSHLMQAKFIIVSQLGDTVNFDVDYGEDNKKEDVDTVDGNTMKLLANELESSVKTMGEEEDLCEGASPETASLNCLEDDRERQLTKMMEELDRLKRLNQQLSGEVTPNDNPGQRLHEMQMELKQLKQLSHQVKTLEAAKEHVSDASSFGDWQSLAAARGALTKASIESAEAETKLAEATNANAQSKLLLVKSKSEEIANESSGVFEPMLGDDLYLVGSGARKKALIKVYDVGMYCSLPALEALSTASTKKCEDSQRNLCQAARTFDSKPATTSFVFRMKLKADAQTVASAISDSVRLRHGGPAADVKELEGLIFRGVESIGCKVKEGTYLRFDCSKDGVGVSVNGELQGMARSEDIGSAFVDVFMDEDAVSPQLIENCLNAWCGGELYQEEAKAAEHVNALACRVKDAHLTEQKMREIVKQLEAKEEQRDVTNADAAVADDGKKLEDAEELFKLEEARLADEAERRQAKDDAEKAAEQHRQRLAAIEAMIMPLKEKATGQTFEPKLDDGLYLVGVGVRKKAILNIYAVGLYSSISVLQSLSPFPNGEKSSSARKALTQAARSFDPSSPMTSLVLNMVFKADAQTIAGAIAEGVKPRYKGPASDVQELESLIIEGVKGKGGQATKGTMFRFDCSTDGVSVSVDGKLQGMARFEGMGSAFVDVFADENSVSQQLVSSCLDTWCGSNL